MQEANRLEPRSGPTYAGPDLSFSLFATLQHTCTDKSVSGLKLVNKEKYLIKKISTRVHGVEKILYR